MTSSILVFLLLIVKLQGSMLRLGDVVPDFLFRSTQNPETPISFFEWTGDQWVILFSHPADFSIFLLKCYRSLTLLPLSTRMHFRVGYGGEVA